MKAAILAGFLLCMIGGHAGAGEREMRREFRDLVAADRDAEAMQLLCKMKVLGVACGFDSELAYLEDVGTLWHRRYDAVFTPPVNADAMAGSSWAQATPASRYTSDGIAVVGSAAAGEVARFVQATANGEPDQAPIDASSSLGYLTVQYREKPYAKIDLDLDGMPDVTFDGSVELLSPDLEMIADDAQDGERFQWLIGSRGSEVLQRPRVWIYRDGCYFNLFVDTDGNGWGNCGGGGQLPGEGK
jgi:hypothetical protein